MKIWKKGRKWSYLAWVRIYWSRDNCLSRYHGWSSVGREVSGVRDAEFLSVLYHRVSVAGLGNGLNGWRRGVGRMWGLERMPQATRRGWRTVVHWCRLWQEMWNGTSAEVKTRILNSWPQIGIGAPTICWPTSQSFTFVSVSDFESGADCEIPLCILVANVTWLWLRNTVLVPVAIRTSLLNLSSYLSLAYLTHQPSPM